MVAISDAVFFARLKAVIEQGWIQIPDRPGYGGSGGPGLLLEEMIGIDPNNRDGPDTEEMIGIDPNNRDGPDTGIWELKYHGGTAPITLFHLTPQPKGNMHNVVRGYGWPDTEGRTSFRHTIWGQSPRGFYVVNEGNQIIVRNEAQGTRPDIIPPHWTHDSLINAFIYKLRRLAVVQGRKRNGWVRYETAHLHWEPNASGFISAIERGIIAIDFDARTNLEGQGLRDHGTKFRVKLDDLRHLYSENKCFGF